MVGLRSFLRFVQLQSLNFFLFVNSSDIDSLLQKRTGILGLLKKDDKNVETNIDNTLVAAPSGTAPKDIKVIDVVPKSLALSNVTSVV